MMRLDGSWAKTMSKTKVTRKIAIELQCHECMGNYADSRQDCECVRCPLYQWMPYRKKEPDLSCFAFNPRRVGKVTWEESEREMTDEQRAEMSERMKRMHDNG